MRQLCGKVAYARIDIKKLSNFRAFSCRDIHRMLASYVRIYSIWCVVSITEICPRVWSFNFYLLIKYGRRLICFRNNRQIIHFT